MSQSVESPNVRHHFAQTTVPKGFHVMVYRGPPQSFYPVASAKFKVGFSSTPLNESRQNQNWFPGFTTSHDPSKSFSASSGTVKSRSQLTTSTALNRGYEPTTRGTAPSYSIYQSLNDTYVYEASISSKSDFLSTPSEDDESSTPAYSPPPLYSPTVSSDSLATFKSPSTTDDISLLDTIPRSLASTKSQNSFGLAPTVPAHPTDRRFLGPQPDQPSHISDSHATQPALSRPPPASVRTADGSHPRTPSAPLPNAPPILRPVGHTSGSEDRSASYESPTTPTSGPPSPAYAPSTASDFERLERDHIARVNAEYNAALSTPSHFAKRGPSVLVSSPHRVTTTTTTTLAQPPYPNVPSHSTPEYHSAVDPVRLSSSPQSTTIFGKNGLPRSQAAAYHYVPSSTSTVSQDQFIPSSAGPEDHSEQPARRVTSPRRSPEARTSPSHIPQFINEGPARTRYVPASHTLSPKSQAPIPDTTNALFDQEVLRHSPPLNTLPPTIPQTWASTAHKELLRTANTPSPQPRVGADSHPPLIMGFSSPHRRRNSSTSSGSTSDHSSGERRKFSRSGMRDPTHASKYVPRETTVPGGLLPPLTRSFSERGSDPTLQLQLHLPQAAAHGVPPPPPAFIQRSPSEHLMDIPPKYSARRPDELQRSLSRADHATAPANHRTGYNPSRRHNAERASSRSADLPRSHFEDLEGSTEYSPRSRHLSNTSRPTYTVTPSPTHRPSSEGSPKQGPHVSPKLSSTLDHDGATRGYDSTPELSARRSPPESRRPSGESRTRGTTTLTYPEIDDSDTDSTSSSLSRRPSASRRVFYDSDDDDADRPPRDKYSSRNIDRSRSPGARPSRVDPTSGDYAPPPLSSKPSPDHRGRREHVMMQHPARNASESHSSPLRRTTTSSPVSIFGPESHSAGSPSNRVQNIRNSPRERPNNDVVDSVTTTTSGGAARYSPSQMLQVDSEQPSPSSRDNLKASAGQLPDSPRAKPKANGSGSPPAQTPSAVLDHTLSKSQRRRSDSDTSHHQHHRSPEPHRRSSDGDQFPQHYGSAKNSLTLFRTVRWNEDLICPSPIPPSERRKGWFNRRGDQLWTNNGAYKPPLEGKDYPLDLDGYPEPGEGWMNEEGVRIDMGHRLIPKAPLRSALKQSPALKPL